MSILTTTAIQNTASGTLGVSVLTGAAGYGSWVEVIALTSAAIQVAGWSSGELTSGGSTAIYQIGIGPAGSEVAVGGELAAFVISPGNQKTNIWRLPIPLDVIPSGVRVAVRAKKIPAGSDTVTDFSLHYYEGLDSDHVTTRSYAYTPAASYVNVVANTTAWANTDWAELLSGVGHEITLLGINFNWGSEVSVKPYELDVGTGAAGSEAVLTTLRGCAVQNGFGVHWLVPYPLVANTRIALRGRKAGTDAATAEASLIYLDNTAILPRVHRFPPISIAM